MKVLLFTVLLIIFSILQKSYVQPLLIAEEEFPNESDSKHGINKRSFHNETYLNQLYNGTQDMKYNDSASNRTYQGIIFAENNTVYNYSTNIYPVRNGSVLYNHNNYSVDVNEFQNRNLSYNSSYTGNLNGFQSRNVSYNQTGLLSKSLKHHHHLQNHHKSHRGRHHREGNKIHKGDIYMRREHPNNKHHGHKHNSHDVKHHRNRKDKRFGRGNYVGFENGVRNGKQTLLEYRKSMHNFHHGEGKHHHRNKPMKNYNKTHKHHHNKKHNRKHGHHHNYHHKRNNSHL